MACAPDGPGSQHRRGRHRHRRGRPLKKITRRRGGEILLLKDTLNTMVEQLRFLRREVTRVAREVGTEGRLADRPSCPTSPAPEDLTDSVNPWRTT